MAEDIKINPDLILSMNALIKNPFLIMDALGNILSFNAKASELFQNYPLNNIFDLLNSSSAEQFHTLIESTVNGVPVFKEPVKISFKHLEVNGKITLAPYIENKSTFLFCEIEESSASIDYQDNNFNIIFETDEGIKLLAEDLLTDFPMSLTGKEKVRKKLDALPYIAWLEDLSGNLLLMNKHYRSFLSLKNNVYEGKSVEQFIAPVYKPLWNSLNDLIISRGTIIRFEDIFFNIVGPKNKKEIVKAPFYDSRKNVLAVLGIIKPSDKGNEQNLHEKLNISGIDVLTPFIELFPFSAAIISSNGEILTYNNSFEIHFKEKLQSSEKRIIQGILPSEMYDRIEHFRESNNSDIKFSFGGNIFGYVRKKESFNVYLKKILSRDILEGLLILIEEDLDLDEFENIFRKRGPMFQILIEKNPEPVFIYDTDNLSFLEVNDAALKLYGYKKDEFLQMDLTDLYTPEDIQTLLDSSVTKDNFGTFSGPFKHRKKDGSTVFVEISKIQFKHNGKDAHYNIIKDITEKLELKKNIQLYKSVFDKSPSLIFITDGNGFVRYANRAVYDSLQYKKEELNYTSFAAFVKDDKRALVNNTIFNSHTRETVVLKIDLKKSDGSLIKTELNASPVLDYKGDSESYMIICTSDKEVKVQEVIKEVIREVPIIEQQPGGLAGELDNTFLSGMFHEILTPINVIIGFVQELNESSSEITPEQKEAFEIINQNRITLLNSMNSVLEYLNMSKKEGDLNIQEVSITEIIDYLQKDFEEISKGRKDVEFSYGKISSSLRFKTDKQKFQFLVSALLRIVTELNPGKKIYFSAYQHPENKFVISIKDSYSSISEDLLQKIKSIFLDESDKDYGVSKMSIKVSRKILKLLGGSFEKFIKEGNKNDYGFVFLQVLSFENLSREPQENLTSYLLEPARDIKTEISYDTVKDNLSEQSYEEKITRDFLDNISETAVPEKNAVVTSFKPEKINLSELSCLYIEDQIDSQILFKVQMKDLKDIKFAVSFEEALPLLDTCHFDFIVMDINLQGEYNGLDALKIIHKMPQYHKIPIIAATAYVLPGDKEKFILTGFNDFISKPIFREKMIDSLERIFPSSSI